MMAFTGILIAAIAVAMLVFFDGSLVWSILAALAGIALLVLSFFKEKKLTKLLNWVLLAAALACLYFIPYQKNTHPIWETVYQAEQASRKKPEKASARLEEIIENADDHYDTLYFRLATSKLAEGKLQDACEALNKVDYNTSYYYYYKQVIMAAADTAGADCDFFNAGDDFPEKLQDHAYEAMVACPDWAQDYTLYGLLTFDLDHNMDIARYVLAGSVNIDSKEGTAWYYLGRVEYYLANYDKALTYFETAEKYAGTMPDAYKSELMQYLEAARKEVNS